MDFDFIPEDEKGLNGFLDKIEGEGSDALAERVVEWEKAICLYNTGTPEPPRRNDYAQFRANLIKPTARRKAGILTEQKPEIDILPLASGYTTTANTLKRVIAAGWEQHGMQAALDDISNILQVLSSAFLEIGWDQHAAFGMGDICINPGDPRQFIVDPAITRARDLYRAQYMRVRTVVPLYIQAGLYPAVADQLKPCGKLVATEPDPRQPSGLGGALMRATQRWRGKQYQKDPPYERVQADLYWFRDPRRDEDHQLVYPNGRCVVRCNDDIICLTRELSKATLREETQNPYYDGEWPFEWLDNIPDINTAWGQDEVLAARWIQNTFDRIGNAVTQTMIDNARPFIIAPKNSLDKDNVNVLERLNHIVLQYTAGRGEVTRQPSPIPTGVYPQIMQMCQALLEYTEGLQDAGGGTPGAKGRVEVRSSALLEGLQNAAQVLIRGQARRLEDFLQRVGQKWISRIFQYYDVNRLMWFVGPQTTEQFEFQRAQLVDEVLGAALQKLQEQFDKTQARRGNGAVNPVTMPASILLTEQAAESGEGDEDEHDDGE